MDVHKTKHPYLEHASPVALKKLVQALNPKKVMPIHTFQPEQYEKLYPNVGMHRDGRGGKSVNSWYN